MLRHATGSRLSLLGVLVVAIVFVSAAFALPSAQSQSETPGPTEYAYGEAVRSGAVAQGVFLPKYESSNTKDAFMAIDPSGRLHAAYSPASGDASGDYWVHYTQCAGDCMNPGNWQGVVVGQTGVFGGDVRLALDSQGRPRLLWFRQSGLSDPGTYVYAACDQNCTAPSNWTETDITSSNVGPSEGRYFGVDHQGRPRFLYTDTEVGHTGTFYVYCDTGCTSVSNWYEGWFSGDYLLDDFSLTFSTTGDPRLAYTFYDNSSSERLLRYAECASNCWAYDSWQRVTLPAAVSASYGFSLRLDAANRPRMAFYSGWTNNEQYDNRLYYMYCQSGCTTPSNWKMVKLGMPEYYGLNPDIAIDTQGNPRIAYNVDTSPYGLHYSWCTANCESAGGSWQGQWVETSEDLNASAPVDPKPGCSISVWFTGIKPSLALGPGNSAHIGSNAEHTQGGTCYAHTDIRLARYNNQGGSAPGLTATPTRTPTRTPTVTPTSTKTPGAGSPTRTPTRAPTYPPGTLRHYLPLVRSGG